MCGIAGIFSPRLGTAERESAVRRMVDRQRHRGPDDAGLVSAGPVTLGMCRLAIFDPAHGRQPMVTPDGRFHLVFNGAIYNHRELRTRLEGEGWVFRTHCDTEVLLAAWARWGEAALPRLRGMFAFAVWDAREAVLVAARGPLGIKPLYYARHADDTVIVASELNGLLAGGLHTREIDPVAVGDYLAWFAVPAPRTIYRGISSLRPGHFLRVDATGKFQVSCWWRLPEAAGGGRREGGGGRRKNGDDGDGVSREGFAREVRARLEDTIRAHMLADVPVGAFLSGGLDSTAIVGLMTAAGAGRLKTFSVVFEEDEYSERGPAREAARAFGTDHHEEVLTGRRLVEELPRILESFDQPTGDGINTWYASRAASAGGVKVALSGLGGDELFGGYPSFRDVPRLARWLPWWRQLPAAARAGVVGWLRAGDVRRRKLADLLEHGRDLHEVCSLRRRVWSEDARLGLLAPEAGELARRQGAHHPLLDDLVGELACADDFQVTSAWEMRTYMADVLLRDSDVFSMAHSLELRVPFVDRVLVEWWWNQPAALKFDPNRPKSALADAVAGLVPASIRQRSKQGFTLPFARWMRQELRPFLDETFSSASLGGCPWLEAGAVGAEYARFSQGSDAAAWSRIWTLAMLVSFANRKASP